MAIDPRVSALCQEFGVEIIDANRYPEPRQTRAPATIQRIIHGRGEAHARLVMTTLAETSNNQVCLDESGLWATSDLIIAWANVVEHRTSEWLAAWDAAPVGELQFRNLMLSGIVRQRPALAGQLHERFYGRFGPDAAQLDLLDDRRRVG
jgi:hypothetical protein